MPFSEIIDAAVKILVGIGGCAAFWAFLQSARDRDSPTPAVVAPVKQDVDIMALGRQELREDYQECRSSLNQMRRAAETFLVLWDGLSSRFIPVGDGQVSVTVDAHELSDLRGGASELRTHLN